MKGEVDDTLGDMANLENVIEDKFQQLENFDRSRRTGDLRAILPRETVLDIQDCVRSVQADFGWPIERSRFFIERVPGVIDNSILNVDVENIVTNSENIDCILSTIEVELHLDKVSRKTEDKRVWLLCDELRIAAKRFEKP